MAEDNYYIILGLDPSVDDWDEIEKRLKEKKRKWSKEATMGSPKNRQRAARYIEIYDDIVSTLKNPETRRKIAREAQKIIDEERKVKLKELDRRISLLKIYESCSYKRVKEIYKKFAGDFTEKEVEDRIISAGIRIRYPKPQISNEDKKKIDDNLEFLESLKISNLYELLDESPETSFQILKEKANERNKAILNSGKTDTESNAKKVLYGICMKLFKDEDNKKKYDNTLSLWLMDELKSLINEAGEDSFISKGEMDILVKEAVDTGVKKEDAVDYIYDYAEERNWKVEHKIKDNGGDDEKRKEKHERKTDYYKDSQKIGHKRHWVTGLLASGFLLIVLVAVFAIVIPRINKPKSARTDKPKPGEAVVTKDNTGKTDAQSRETKVIQNQEKQPSDVLSQKKYGFLDVQNVKLSQIDIYVDNKKVGTTPITNPFEVETGRHSIILKNPDTGKTWQRAYNFKGEKTIVLPEGIDMTGYGYLKVANVKPWADVYIDSKKVATTPISDSIRVRAGKHSIILKNPEDKWQIEYTFRDGKTYVLPDIDLRPGYLKVANVKPWGNIYIDGKKVGVTPISTPVRVRAGTHSIKIENPNTGNKWQKTHDFGKGETYTLPEIDLR